MASRPDAATTGITERRDVLRRARLNDHGAAERTAKLHESAARIEPGVRGTLAVLTGESLETLARLGF